MIICYFVSLLLLLPTSFQDDHIITECTQGSVRSSNTTECVMCPANTYWRQIIVNDTEVSGSKCVGCPQLFVSPEGSTDFTKCICDNDLCKSVAPKGNNLPVIITIISVIVGLVILVVCLVYCKMYSTEFIKCIRSSDHEELANDDDSLLHSSPALLDCEINVDDDEIDDAYNDITTKGDINDINAVLRAAVISEKRRSRCISLSSMTDLTSQSGRYRTVSMNSGSVPVPGGSNYGIEKIDEGSQSNNYRTYLPLPSYNNVIGRNGSKTTAF